MLLAVKLKQTDGLFKECVGIFLSPHAFHKEPACCVSDSSFEGEVNVPKLSRPRSVTALYLTMKFDLCLLLSKNDYGF